MKFLLETSPSITPDTATVMDMINQINWFNDNQILWRGISIEEIKGYENDWIPVGSVNFIENYMRLHCNKPRITPIQIPTSLQNPDFLWREIGFVNSTNKLYAKNQLIHFAEAITTSSSDRVFVKDMTGIKKGDFTDIYRVDELHNLPAVNSYFISEYVDILSECRVFVFHGRPIAMRNYSGDPWLVPDREVTEKMIETYEKCQATPPAYVLDVALLENGMTALIEVQNFLACGLYGWEDIRIPKMIYEAFKYECKPES